MNFDEIRFERTNFKFRKFNDIMEYAELPIYEVILFKSYKELNLELSNKELDKVYVFLSMLLLKNKRSDWEFIHRDYMKHIFGNDYKKYIDLLVEKDVIETTKNQEHLSSTEWIKAYEVGSRSIGYRLKGWHIFEDTCIVTLNNPYYIDTTKNGKPIKFFKELMKMIEYNSIARITMHTQRDFYRGKDKSAIILPTKREVIDEARRLVSIDAMNKKGKIYRFFDEEIIDDLKEFEKTYTDINYGIKQFNKLLSDGWGKPTSNGDSGRVTDRFNLMSGWVRKLFKFKYKNKVENMKELDFTALHPNIWCLLLDYIPLEEKNFFLENIAGDSHTKIANATGLTRKEVKTAFLSFFNTEERWMDKGKYEKIYEFYKSNVPTLLNLIIKTKSSNHCDTSKFLFNNESILIENILVYCYKEKIPVCQVYDAVYVPESVSEQVKNYTNELYKNVLTTTIGE